MNTKIAIALLCALLLGAIGRDLVGARLAHAAPEPAFTRGDVTSIVRALQENASSNAKIADAVRDNTSASAKIADAVRDAGRACK